MKMNLINKITISTIGLLVFAVALSILFTNTSAVEAQTARAPQNLVAQADSGGNELDLKTFNSNLSGESANPDEEVSCAGVKIAFDVGCRDDFSNPILAYLVAILRFLTYGVGIVVIMMIVVGGIQYSAAGGNAQSVGAAKARILNAVIALILYIFAFAILNFVVPGGLIG